MELAKSILSWLFFESMIGIVVITGIVLIVFILLQKVIPKAPNPLYIACAVFFIGLFTLPSIPRYKFEKDVFTELNGKDWVRIVDKIKRGHIAEPLTLIKTPVGYFKAVMPNVDDIVMPNSDDIAAFTEGIFQYKKEPILSIVITDCNKHIILQYSQPDNEGVYRQLLEEPIKMNEDEKRIYCEYDWTKEKQALDEEMLK